MVHINTSSSMYTGSIAVVIYKAVHCISYIPPSQSQASKEKNGKSIITFEEEPGNEVLVKQDT